MEIVALAAFFGIVTGLAYLGPILSAKKDMPPRLPVQDDSKFNPDMEPYFGSRVVASFVDNHPQTT